MKTIIEYEQFAALDIRVGQVIAADAPAWSNKLLQLTVDFGSEIGQRTLLTGIRKWYQPADLMGNLYPCIINLAPRKMGEVISEGMMIMGDCLIDGELRPVLMPLPTNMPVGSQIR